MRHVGFGVTETWDGSETSRELPERSMTGCRLDLRGPNTASRCRGRREEHLTARWSGSKSSINASIVLHACRTWISYLPNVALEPGPRWECRQEGPIRDARYTLGRPAPVDLLHTGSRPVLYSWLTLLLDPRILLTLAAVFVQARLATERTLTLRLTPPQRRHVRARINRAPDQVGHQL